MNDRTEVRSQVALAALLDVDCLELALLDDEMIADATLWAGDGATEYLASHPGVSRLVEAAVVSPRAQVRATVAARPDLDATIYPMLASDVEQSVRARVAGNHAAPHAVLLPHIGSATEATRRRMAQLASEGAVAVLAGERPPNLVN